MRTRSRVLVAFALLSLAPSAPVLAQVRASEIGSFTQFIDGTKVTMQYSRPRLRGRDPIFGTTAVHWGEVWTPGANFATTFEVDKNVKLDGHVVPKGQYSVWFVVRQSGDWTMVLDPKSKLYHMHPPDSNATQIRFPVRAKEAPLADVLTWSMPELRMDGGTLAFTWAKTAVTMNLEVQPSLQTTLAESEAAPYLGHYSYVEKDSAGHEKKKTFVVDYENGTLKAAWEPVDGYFKHFALVRVAPDWFVPGIYDEKGVVYEVLRPEMTFEFTRVNGRATSFQLRDQDDRVGATGTRKP